jgi:hypothetical protein
LPIHLRIPRATIRHVPSGYSVVKILNNSALALSIALLAIAEWVCASQPPDVVASDDNGSTAMGRAALSMLSSGINSGTQDTAAGFSALSSNTTGTLNTALGYEALFLNTTGGANTALGPNTLYFNTTGNNNTAVGPQALFFNVTGQYNTAAGVNALFQNSFGQDNTATGYLALTDNTTASDNTAYGANALANNTSGSSNVAEGWHAGFNLTTGSNNIDIGNAGAAGDANTIKIGTQNAQTKTFIAAISGISVSGNAVMVSSTGQLGVVVSSERFKTAISTMGSISEKLQQLRPVTFRLKTDPKGILQYGLIAEEVAKVYPDLLVRNESRRIDGVRYDELAPMLLNEAQRQQRLIAAQAGRNAAQPADIRELKKQMLS